MNAVIREVVKQKDIFKTCDLMAIKNKNETYFILYNRNGEKGLLSNELFKNELAKSNEPIILNCELFSDKNLNL